MSEGGENCRTKDTPWMVSTCKIAGSLMGMRISRGDHVFFRNLRRDDRILVVRLNKDLVCDCYVRVARELLGLFVPTGEGDAEVVDYKTGVLLERAYATALTRSEVTKHRQEGDVSR